MSYYLEPAIIIGTFASFVEDGTEITIPGSPATTNDVSRSFFPDPSTNPNDWNSLGCVIQSQIVPGVQGPEISCPSEDGGYDSEQDLGEVLNLSLKCQFEIIHRLIWGVSAKLVDNTPVRPFTDAKRVVHGWLHFRAKGEDGDERIVATLRGKLSLPERPIWNNQPVLPAVAFTINKRNTLNTITPDNITAAP